MFYQLSHAGQGSIRFWRQWKAGGVTERNIHVREPRRHCLLPMARPGPEMEPAPRYMPLASSCGSSGCGTERGPPTPEAGGFRQQVPCPTGDSVSLLFSPDCVFSDHKNNRCRNVQNRAHGAGGRGDTTDDDEVAACCSCCSGHRPSAPGGRRGRRPCAGSASSFAASLSLGQQPGLRSLRPDFVPTPLSPLGGWHLPYKSRMRGREAGAAALESRLAVPRTIKQSPYVSRFHSWYPPRSNENTRPRTKACAAVLATLFTVTPRWEQPPCPRNHEWGGGMGCVHSVEHYGAAERRGGLTPATTRVVLRDRSQAGGATGYMVP